MMAATATRAHVITGSFGSGKTTAIRWLMAHKPEDELWVVILNEFTDAGIDALSVAQAARGNYDVRLVAGGCLCCVGELEFGKQLRDLLRNFKPARLLIEPSGAGHAADIVDTLALYEDAEERCNSTASFVWSIRRTPAEFSTKRPPIEWSQIQSADALLLSKPDLANESERRRLSSGLRRNSIRKSPILALAATASCPQEALHKFAARAAVFPGRQIRRPLPRRRSSAFEIAGLHGTETQLQALGFWAVQWTLPRELVFARAILEPRLSWLLEADQGWLRRMKGVFRTGLGPSWLVQAHGPWAAGEDSAFRRDSRIEMVLSAAPTDEYLEAVARPVARCRESAEALSIPRASIRARGTSR